LSIQKKIRNLLFDIVLPQKHAIAMIIEKLITTNKQIRNYDWI